jgi:hypothetical protein
MLELFFALVEQLDPVLRKGDLANCEAAITDQLRSLPQSPFHIIHDLNITNPPEQVAAHFDNFIEYEEKRFPIKAVYTEMNGFDINPDRWYFELFGYRQYGGREDYDWLADWQSEDYPEMTVTGLEPLQKVYASDAFRAEEFFDASNITSLLVVVKFQDLIRRAAPHMRRLMFPLLATAHDYDFIYKVRQDGG